MPFRTYGSRPRAKSGSLFETPGAATMPDNAVIARTDGGARGNPGPAGYGVSITDREGKPIVELKKYLGHQTNNVAEYSALLAALEYAVSHGHTAVKLYSDSELMVKQIRGEYKVSNSILQDLHRQAKALIAKLQWFNIQHVLRGQNADADRLANEAMDEGSRRR